ncbi:hypothetical protein BX600DRAFT_460624 [Xylariales sp. PMI_506]|nr:hypothetical protein BX600DRAFT_460624 [Xylariales sp. PMI_506]
MSCPGVRGIIVVIAMKLTTALPWMPLFEDRPYGTRVHGHPRKFPGAGNIYGRIWTLSANDNQWVHQFTSHEMCQS